LRIRGQIARHREDRKSRCRWNLNNVWIVVATALAGIVILRLDSQGALKNGCAAAIHNGNAFKAFLPEYLYRSQSLPTGQADDHDGGTIPRVTCFNDKLSLASPPIEAMPSASCAGLSAMIRPLRNFMPRRATFLLDPGMRGRDRPPRRVVEIGDHLGDSSSCPEEIEDQPVGMTRRRTSSTSS
jgi:hypothetical protein